MDRKLFLSSSLAVLLAATTVFLLHENSYQSLKYRFKADSAVKRDLELTIDKFNKLYASFYVTGGSTFGLDEFPAANIIKRRIYQDIDLWQQQGQWLIHDLHNQEIKRVEVLSPGWAIVETEEVWDLWLRDIKTGRKSGRKTNAIQLRYHLARDRGRWLVVEFEVFGQDEDLPAINKSLL